jgi:transposase
VTVPMDVHSDRVSRLEVIETGRRRRFSRAQKLRIVEESLWGHRQASSTARRHDISNSLLFRWRKAYREGRLTAEDAPCSFVPALVMADAGSESAPTAQTAGRMEIVAQGGRRVLVGADVDATALARVLEVLERRGPGEGG